jgi:hypothetical protein
MSFKAAKMSRRIPIIRMRLKNGETLQKIQEHPGFQEIIHEELIFAIEDGVRKNQKSVTLFQIDNFDYSLELKRTEWKQSLNHVMQAYIASQDYIKCCKIRDLISQI